MAGGRDLATIFELDALVLNEDRHTNNLAVIRDDATKAFRLCPLSDHGLSLLSNTNDYPLKQDVYKCIGRVQAKPFSEDFPEQAEAAAALYGSDLHLAAQGTISPRCWRAWRSCMIRRLSREPNRYFGNRCGGTPICSDDVWIRSQTRYRQRQGIGFDKPMPCLYGGPYQDGC